MELDHEENHIVRMLVQNAKEMNYKGLDCYLIVTKDANYTRVQDHLQFTENNRFENSDAGHVSARDLMNAR